MLSSCKCILGLPCDHMVPYECIFDQRGPTWTHLGPTLVPHGFPLRQSWVHMNSYRVHFGIDMYPYGIVWSHIGVLWIHVGYIWDSYGFIAPHWIHTNPCLTDVVSIWISCWVQFCFICISVGHMWTTYEATWGSYVRMRLGPFKNAATWWMLQIRYQVEAHRYTFQPL